MAPSTSPLQVLTNLAPTHRLEVPTWWFHAFVAWLVHTVTVAVWHVRVFVLTEDRRHFLPFTWAATVLTVSAIILAVRP